MLEIVALGILVFTAVSLMFGAIAIVGIPHQIAVERSHPHQDAIYLAGWVSLFTLHTIWPLLWVWSAAYREKPLPKFVEINEDTAINDKAPAETSAAVLEIVQLDADITDSVTLLGHKCEVLDDRIDRIENAIMAAGKAA
jgi:Protein of unknown function (DUF3302)